MDNSDKLVTSTGKQSKNTTLYTFQSSTSIMLWAEPSGIYSNFDTAIQPQTTTSYIGLHYNIFLDMWPRTLMWNTVRCNQNKNKWNSKICNRLAKLFLLTEFRFMARESSISLCKSGTSFNTRNRCILDFDVYGDVIGCRDLTHLNDCGKEVYSTFKKFLFMSAQVSSFLWHLNNTGSALPKNLNPFFLRCTRQSVK